MQYKLCTINNIWREIVFILQKVCALAGGIYISDEKFKCKTGVDDMYTPGIWEQVIKILYVYLYSPGI